MSIVETGRRESTHFLENVATHTMIFCQFGECEYVQYVNTYPHHTKCLISFKKRGGDSHTFFKRGHTVHIPIGGTLVTPIHTFVYIIISSSHHQGKGRNTHTHTLFFNGDHDTYSNWGTSHANTIPPVCGQVIGGGKSSGLLSAVWKGKGVKGPSGKGEGLR